MNYSPFWRICVLLASQACLTPVLAAASKAGSDRSYTVKTGDTFAKIARTQGITLGQLLKANRIANPDYIVLGQRIVIPGNGPAAPKPAVTRPAPAAAKLRPPASTSDRRQAGSKPAPSTAGKPRREPADSDAIDLTPPAMEGTYIVGSGDTLSRIQRTTKVPVTTLMKLNGLTETSTIRPGQTLRLSAGARLPKPAAKLSPGRQEALAASADAEPAGLPGEPVSTARDSRPPAPTGTAPHKIGSGETFSSISRLYGVTSAQLTAANKGINPAKLRIGQTLMIPGQPVRPQPKPQMVRADGRVLADRPDPLSIGGESNDEVPAGRTRTGYLVEEGETVQEIARRFHTTEATIRRLNRLQDGDTIYAGRYILVPFLRQSPAQYSRDT